MISQASETLNQTEPSQTERAQKPAQNGKADEWPLALTRGGTTVRVFRATSPTGYEYFTVSYYQEGKRRREVLGEEQKARERARAVLKSLAGGEIDAASMRLQDVRAYESAKALLAPTGVTLETACREYATTFSLLGGVSLVQAVQEWAQRRASIVAHKTVPQVAEELMEAKFDGKATRKGGKARSVGDRYLDQLQLRLDKFTEKFTGQITEVTAEAINDWVSGLKGPKGKPLTGRTRNNYVETIRVLFNYAKKQRYLAKDSEVVERMELFAEDDFDIEIFTPEELVKLLAAAPETSEGLQTAMLFGAFGGLRYAEICRLDWKDVKLEAGHIELKAGKTKTRSRRLVPITSNLRSFLESIEKKKGPVWPWVDTYMAEAQRRCGAKAGVPWKHNALRHSFISYRVAKVKNVHQVALEAGNSPDIIFQHYRELVTEKQAKEWFAITPAKVEAWRAQAEAERKAKIVSLAAAAAA